MEEGEGRTNVGGGESACKKGEKEDLCGGTGACKKVEGKEEGRTNVCGAKNVSRIRKRRGRRGGGRGEGKGREEGRKERRKRRRGERGVGMGGGEEGRRGGGEKVGEEKGEEGGEEEGRTCLWGKAYTQEGCEGRRGENKYLWRRWTDQEERGKCLW